VPVTEGLVVVEAPGVPVPISGAVGLAVVEVPGIAVPTALEVAVVPPPVEEVPVASAVVVFPTAGASVAAMVEVPRGASVTLGSVVTAGVEAFWVAGEQAPNIRLKIRIRGVRNKILRILSSLFGKVFFYLLSGHVTF